MIFSSENIFFLIFSKCQPLLLVFTNISNSCIFNTNCPSPKLLDGAKILPKNFNPLGRAQQRHRRQTQTDGSCHKANVT